MTCLPRMMVLVVGCLWLAAPAVCADGPKADLTPEQRKDIAKEATRLNEEAVRLVRSGRYAEAVPILQRSIVLRQQLYPPDKYPDGHADLATGLHNLGAVLDAIGAYEMARPYHEQALAMRQRLYSREKYPDGHPDLAASLNSMGYLLHSMGAYEKALPYYEQALAMRQRLYPRKRYPDGHPDLAEGLNNLGYLLKLMGAYEEARPYYEQTLAMYQTLYPREKYPDGHPDLATSLNNLGDLLESMGAYGKARPYYEQALAMYQTLYPREKYPDGHPDLALSLSNLGYLLKSMGAFETARPYYEQALAMRQRLYPQERYPDGHPDLAQSLNNLGDLLDSVGAYEKALPFYEQALAMRQRFYLPKKYPNGHPELARSLNNLGAVLDSMGAYEKARPYYEQALAMKQRLYPREKYPDGHPELAGSLNNLGCLLLSIGAYEKARPYYEQALAMNLRLYPRGKYPDGHPDLARSLTSLGGLLFATGAYDKALFHFEKSLAAYQRYIEMEATAAPEADALALLDTLPMTRDAYVSTVLHMADTDAASYDQVWQTKAAITRLLERRHVAARVALADRRTGGGLKDLWEQLAVVRRQIARLTLARGPDPAARDRRLAELTDTRDRLERELARALPDLPRPADRDRHTAADLIRVLPAGTAFVDILRFTRFEQDPKVPGLKGQRRTDSYCAFILRPGLKVVRVDLGEAKPIDEAVSAWCRTVRGTLNPDGAEIKRLIWEPLAEHLGPEVTAVYISPDGELSRLPWAALPGSKPGTVLLEEFAMAVVPHGPFLLEQLLHPPAAADPTGEVLTLGGVPYGTQPPGTGLTKYPPLRGTGREQARIKTLAGGRPVTPLTGTDATARRLLEELPKARSAHLGTHGFFDEARLVEEHRRQRAELDRLRRGYTLSDGHGMPRVGLGTRSPLAYTGLALAGANDPATAGAEGGIITGEQLVQLPLEHLQLAVLSACETGLGELTGGEGVQGLVRAFHLAGCPTVIASLWSIDDDATAALMTVFYDGLWTKGQPPREALRRAQLAIYHHPELSRALAGDDDDARAAALLQVDRPPAGDRRAKTRQWAAFVLSGTGR